MFDNVKCVVSWTTMACHVYNLVYCKMMTTVICDLQYEDMEFQQVMWTKLNDMMLKHNFPKSKFKGFMANNAQSNQNVVIIVYGLGDPSMRMLIRSAHVYSTRLNHLINAPKYCSNPNCKINTLFFAISIRAQNPFKRLTIATLTLGSRPRQGLAKVQAKIEAQESHFMLPGVQGSVRE